MRYHPEADNPIATPIIYQLMFGISPAMPPSQPARRCDILIRQTAAPAHPTSPSHRKGPSDDDTDN